MLFTNRNYPHPVLGISDDYKNSIISMKLNIEAKMNFFEIRPIFFLQNNEIQNLIDSNKARYITQIYCRGTMYREVFSSNKSITESITISSKKLNGEVVLDFFIIADAEIIGFGSPDFSDVFDKVKFNISNSEIISYGGQAKFFANKTFSELVGISSLINVICSGKSKKPLNIDYFGERISIILCKEDFDNYKLLKSNPKHWSLILSSIVFPALVEILHFIDTEDSDEFQGKYWYDHLSELKEKHLGEKVIVIAQNIIDNPLSKNLEFEANEYETN